MKFSKIFAGIAACALSVSAMAITSFAAITNANSDGAYTADPVADEGLAINEFSGAVVTITCADGWTESGVGGCVVFQGDGVAWGDGSKEFGVSGEGEDVKNTAGMTVAADGSTITLTYDFGGAIFAETATWSQLVIQSWWGADFTVDEIKYLDLNGDVIGEEPVVTTTTAAEETPVETTTTAAAEEDDTTVTTTAAAEEDDTADTTTTAVAAEDDDTADTTAADTTTAADAITTDAVTTTAAASNNNTGVEGVAGVLALLAIAGTAVVVTKKR